MSKVPEIAIYSHQDVVEFSDEFLNQMVIAGQKAVALALNMEAYENSDLAHLDEVEVSMIDDEKIADIHMRFMAIPGATDVITFAHGEIHISVETAKKQALEYGNNYERELILYIVHGLLHLAGYEDASDEDASRMDRLQQSILDQVWQ